MTITLKPILQTDIEIFFYNTHIICQFLQMQLIKGPTKLIQ